MAAPSPTFAADAAGSLEVPFPGRGALDEMLADLASRRDAWASASLADRVALLDGIRSDLAPLAEEWTCAGLAAKSALDDPYAAGWEWSGGPVVVFRVLGGLRRTLSALAAGPAPFLPAPFTVGPSGRQMLRAYPTSLYERVTTPGVRADVWFRPGATPDEIVRAQRDARTPAPGKTVLVLGAGNVSGLQIADALNQLFGARAVVVLKTSPVTPWLLPLMERGLRRLLDGGWLRLVSGEKEVSSYLCRHPLVDAIHMTGSDRTYEAIVFGEGPVGEARRTRREPALAKPFTAELGNVGPAIVVPGPWSRGDLDDRAEELASHLCDSGSYSCSRTRVILQWAGWPLRSALLERVGRVLDAVPTRFAYYPGGVAQHARFAAAHPEAEHHGAAGAGRLPWTLIPGLSPSKEDELCFRSESFCPVLAETALEAASPAEFVERAFAFANERLWGTLSAGIVVHPQSLGDPSVGPAVERAIEGLHYGIVAVNVVPGFAYAAGTLPWGSYPGNPPWDIQSGAGFANNTFLLGAVEKTVVRGPFRPRPRPIWRPSRARAFGEVLRRALRYETAPSFTRFAALLRAGLG